MSGTRKENGFTLIELLVVITIIGLLSSLAVVSLNSARIKARDALRKADMAQMRTALGLYYMDNNRYPICGSNHFDLAVPPDYGANVSNVADTNVPPADGGGSWCYINTLKEALTTGMKPMLQDMPVDPMNKSNVPLADGGNDNYIYRYASNADGQTYVLVYTLEEEGIKVIKGF